MTTERWLQLKLAATSDELQKRYDKLSSWRQDGDLSTKEFEELQDIELQLQLERKNALQRQFLEALDISSQILTEAGVSNDEYFVISGGAVFLYEQNIDEFGQSTRVPTDLDIVICTTDSSAAALESVCQVAKKYLEDVTLTARPRQHHGFRFTSAILEAKTASSFPIDFMPRMITTFPANNPTCPGMEYKFPVDNRELFRLSPLLACEHLKEIRVAHPAFIIFYKATMLRDSGGKQDTRDIRRLHALGLFEPREEFEAVMDIMCHQDPALKQKVLEVVDEISS